MEKVRVFSLHPTKKEAEEFAKHLIGEGAEGVLVGEKTSGGYPVSSLADSDIVGDVTKEHRLHEEEEAEKAYKAAEEKYDYEGGDIPTTELLAIAEMEGIQPTYTNRQLLDITRDELRKARLKRIKVGISKYHGGLPHAKYADATVFYREHPKPHYKLVLHPICRYHSEDDLRDTIRHEISHIVEGDI